MQGSTCLASRELRGNKGCEPSCLDAFLFIFGYFETRFLWLAVLAVLELAIVEQADLELTEIHLPFIFSQTTIKNQK